MNQQVIFDRLGDIEALQLRDTTIPSPGPNEIVVEVKACGLNRAEYLFFHGQYLFQPELPAKLGMEASGVVYAIGDGVAELSIGDAICLLPNIDITKYGYLGKYVLVPSAHVIAKPKAMNFSTAAAFWTAYGTAYGLLLQEGGLRSDASEQTVLITAASSSVGIAAIQIAKRHGAQVIASTRTGVKKAFLLQTGADTVIVTDEEPMAERVQELTNGNGYDICIDAITGSIVGALAEAAGPEARLLLYGVLDPSPFEFPLYPVLGKGLRISGFHLGFHLLNHLERRKKMSEYLTREYEAGHYSVTIDREFPLAEVRTAYRYLESNVQRGKIVIKV